MSYHAVQNTIPVIKYAVKKIGKNLTVCLKLSLLHTNRNMQRIVEMHTTIPPDHAERTKRAAP